ncbi:13585_t:CDS:2, partial [Funneliformis geosporum]
MGHQEHFLTPYIVVLHFEQRANKSNKYAVCRAYINILGKDKAYKNKFTNTKKESLPISAEINNDDNEYNTPNISDDRLSDEENDNIINGNIQTVSDWQ